MRFRSVAVTAAVVLLSTMALSYVVLLTFPGPTTTIRVGSRRLQISSLNQTQTVWASLLGMSAMGFSVGTAIASNNPSLGLLLGSYSGDWIFRAMITLAIIGAVGGIVAEDRGGATVASALGTILALAFGAALTFQVMPQLMTGIGMSPGEQSELISAIAVSQLAGAIPASLITAITSAIIARMALQMRIIHIEPLKLPPPPPEETKPFRYCPNCGRDLSDFSPSRSTCPRCGEPLPPDRRLSQG